jgi:pyocin large subunit-like protein
MFAIPHTNGFRNETFRRSHWGDHSGDFGTSTVLEYERMADEFLSSPRGHLVLFECSRRRNRALVRYEPATEAFGILGRDGTIQTFFKPVPCAMLPATLVGIKKCHSFATNLEYAQDSCLR